MVEGKSIIQQLYDGDINIYEHTAATKPEHLAILNKIVAEKEYLIGVLPNGDNERLEALQSYMDEAAEYDKKAVFAYAFKLGVRLMMEALVGDIEAESQGKPF